MKFFAKAAITAILLWIVFSRADLRQLTVIWAGAKLLPLILAVLLGVLMLVLDATLFRSVFGALGHRIRFISSFLYSLVGTFVSNFTPSTIGSDVFRAVQMQRLGAPMGTVVRAVLATRLMSFCALALVIVAGLPLSIPLLGDAPQRLLVIAIALASIVGTIALYIAGRLGPRLIASRLAWVNKLGFMARDIDTIFHSGTATLAVLASAIGQHLLRVASLTALGAGLGLGVSFGTMFALTPAALLIAMVPVSIGSWGLREASFLFLLSAAGYTPIAAVALSIAFGGLRLVLGAIGGTAWVFAGKRHYSL